MRFTRDHLRVLELFLANGLERPHQYFLHGWAQPWVLYGTGPAQLTYLGLMWAVAQVFIAAMAAGRRPPAGHPGILAVEDVLRGIRQFSGRKHLAPIVSNYFIRFDENTVQFQQAPGAAGPAAAAAAAAAVPAAQASVRMVGGDFASAASLDFFERYVVSRFSLDGLSPAKLVKGMAKHNGRPPTVVDVSRESVGNYLRQYAVRRACKFLLYDAVDRGKRVRYALDDLDLGFVARAVRVDGKVPVCTSELRELFRYWDYFEPHVTFYWNFWTSPPPWDVSVAKPDELAAWSAYAAHRAGKLLAFAAGNHAVPAAVVTSARECVAAATARRHEEAIAKYHAARPSRFGVMLMSRVNFAASQVEGEFKEAPVATAAAAAAAAAAAGPPGAAAGAFARAAGTGPAASSRD